MAYYDRALRAWRRGMRGPLLIVGGLVAVPAVPAWLFLPHGEFFSGAWLGSTFGMLMWVWDDPPEYIAKWKRGAEGERRTSKILRPLEREGWRAFHDRDSGRGNLDHIVVGPAGVFLLDSKNLAGTISLETAGLTARYADAPRDDFTYTRLGRSITGAAVQLKERLEIEASIRTWVQAVVVIWGDFPEAQGERDDVVYLAGDRLCDWLRERPDRLSARNQRLVQLALDADLVAPPAEAAPLRP